MEHFMEEQSKERIKEMIKLWEDLSASHDLQFALCAE
jgi:hypothetical protein